jgi:hypothetical protein
MLKSSYRALLEWLVVQHHPSSARHQRCANVKNAEQLDFLAYAKSSTTKNPELHAKIIEMVGIRLNSVLTLKFRKATRQSDN